MHYAILYSIKEHLNHSEYLEDTTMTSRHYSEERLIREALIKKIGIGHKVAEFTVDRGHKDGAEIHVITSTAIIVIFNYRTHKLVTKLIARPNQIKRYYKDGNAPAELIEIARDHQRKGYNNY